MEDSGRIVRVVHPRARIRWEPLASAPSDLTVELTTEDAENPPRVWVMSIIDPDQETHVVFVDDEARKQLIAKMSILQP